MITNFRYNICTQFVFGKDAELETGKNLKKMNATKVLIHHDNGKFLYESGLLDNIVKNIQQQNIETIELGGVQPNPRVGLVRKGIEICKNEKIDFILAIGGGSVIDSAKAIALGVYYEGDVWDYFSNGIEANQALPIAVILTCPATGSESGNASLINNEDLNLKRAYTSDIIRPKIAFLNPELTYSLPDYITSCGVVDIFSHVLERYFSPNQEIGVMDYLCEGIMKNLLKYGPKVRENPKSYENRSEIMWTGTIAHNDTCGLGRIQDWGSHMIAHEISALYDTAHGATLSIIIPSWMRYVYKQDKNRFARYAVSVFGVEYDPNNLDVVALEGIERTENFFKKMGLPTSFISANIPVDKLEEMARKATLFSNYVGEFKRLYYDDILKIYNMAIG